MTSTGFFEGLMGVLFKLWHLNMIYFVSLIINASWMQCLLHNQKVNKPGWFPWCLMPIGTIHHLNIQSTVLTNSSVLVGSVVYGEWRWRPHEKIVKFIFIPCMSASVIECRSIGSCNSNGCVQGSWSQISTFSCYSHCLPLTQNASKGVWE